MFGLGKPKSILYFVDVITVMTTPKKEIAIDAPRVGPWATVALRPFAI
jgi:hypothetical protein